MEKICPKAKECGDTGRSNPTLDSPDGQECKCTHTYRLVKLPPIETIKGILRQEVVIDEETVTDRTDTWKAHGGCIHEDYIDTLADQIYASAKPVDIDALAEKIWRAVPEYTGHYNLTKIKQAIEEFIKEKMNHEIN